MPVKNTLFQIMNIYPILFFIGISSIAGCTANPRENYLPIDSDKSAFTSGHYLENTNNPINPTISAGTEALVNGNAEIANLAFNEAISYDMKNASLHVANALAYQIRARNGEHDLLALAETGFLVALEQQHDSENAILQLSHLYLEDKQYASAQLAAAYAIKLDGSSLEPHLLLASASYYLGDVEIALWAIERARKLAPQDATLSLITPLIYSASGLDSQAQKYIEEHEGSISETDKLKIKRRIQQWNVSYESNFIDFAPATAIENSSEEAASRLSSDPDAISSDDKDNILPAANEGPMVYSWSDCVQSITNNGANQTPVITELSNQNVTVDETAILPSLPSPCLGRPLPQMAVIDVVILRNNELNTSARGINLLENLAVTIQKTANKITTLTSGDEPSETTTTLIRDIGLGTSAGGAVAYSLNIANVSEQTTEVVARPSLLVLDRQPAQFFSGSNIIVGIDGGVGSTASFNHINVGVSLSVTPTFLEDDHMLLNVKVARTFFEPITGSSTFGQSIQTSRNMVSAATIVRIDETLVLSGLAENQDVSGEAGVPIIKDIPGIKNLFSRATTQSFKKSVLILITPRQLPSNERRLQNIDEKKLMTEEGSKTINALRQFASKELSVKWPTLHANVKPMPSHQRAFNARTNDINLDDWSSLPRMQTILQEAARPSN